MKFVFNWNLINVNHWRLLKITQGQVLRNCICQLYLRSVNPVGGATLPGKLGGPPKPLDPLPYLWPNSTIFPTRFMTWKSEKLYAFQNWSAITIQKTAAKETIHNRDRTYLYSPYQGVPPAGEHLVLRSAVTEQQLSNNVNHDNLKLLSKALFCNRESTDSPTTRLHAESAWKASYVLAS